MPRASGRLIAAAALLALAACAPTVIPAGPPLGPPRLEPDRLGPDRLVAADGAALPLRRWTPAGAPRAVIVAAHGFMDYSNGLAEPGEAWAKAGIETWAWDQRGFGAAPHRGRWAGAATYAGDLAAAVALARETHPGVPVFALGESMGGAVALVAAAGGELGAVDGLILVAPAVRGRASAGPVASGVFWAFAHTVPWLSGPTGTFIRPSDNDAMLRRFARDPLILRNARLDMMWGLFETMDEAVGSAPRVDQPMLVLLGARDPLVPGGPMREFLDALPPAGPERRRVAVYPDGWHMLLRDLDAARVHADVASWVLTRRSDPAAALPSGADRAAAPGG